MPERNKDSYSSWGPQDLRKERTDMSMTKRDLAKTLGVSERQYAYYESGHTKIDKPLEYAVRWLANSSKDKPVVETGPQGTLTDFQKERIDRLLQAIDNYPTSNLDEKGRKILSQCVDEISVLTQALGDNNG